MRYLGAGLGADEMIEPAGKLAFARVGKAIGQKLGDGKPEHAVAQEFEPLIVLVRLRARCARSHASSASLSSARSVKS